MLLSDLGLVINFPKPLTDGKSAPTKCSVNGIYDYSFQARGHGLRTIIYSSESCTVELFWPAPQSILNHTTRMTFQNANEATSHPCLKSFRGFRGSPLRGFKLISLACHTLTAQPLSTPAPSLLTSPTSSFPPCHGTYPSGQASLLQAVLSSSASSVHLESLWSLTPLLTTGNRREVPYSLWDSQYPASSSS